MKADLKRETVKALKDCRQFIFNREITIDILLSDFIKCLAFLRRDSQITAYKVQSR